MNDISKLRFLLHVSDFHLSDQEEMLKNAKEALHTLCEKFKSEKIKVDYLVHTGDVIDSSDIYQVVADSFSISSEFYKKNDKGKVEFLRTKYEAEATEEDIKKFNEALYRRIAQRFKFAQEVMSEFISELNISFGNVVICCGNHDVIRPLEKNKVKICCTTSTDAKWEYDSEDKVISTFKPFEDFLDNLGAANSAKRCGKTGQVSYCFLGNVRVLILNTNWRNPDDQKPGYYCVNCERVREAIEQIATVPEKSQSPHIILAHKPIYEICEKARLSYKRYIRTPFMSELHKFSGESGKYLCGDKHTRSIIGSFIHDIPHYIGGEPLSIPQKHTESEVEYNLLEVSGADIGMERKIHLSCDDSSNWICSIRPQDAVVSKVFNLCKGYIIKNSFEIIAESKHFSSWESICQEIYSWQPEEREGWYRNLTSLYRAICKYRKNGSVDIPIDCDNIFSFISQNICSQIGTSSSKNILNIRGEYSSGKSTFLGLLFIVLLYQYSAGNLDFIPAYFNLESNAMIPQISSEDSYNSAVKRAFAEFSNDIQSIATKEHQSVCYIIDGLDEQDCWSYRTEDSVGRGLLDVLSQYDKAWYIMSFSQHRLPRFKNTMPIRKYKDSSDILYFNPIDVREKGATDPRFVSFVGAFLKLKKRHTPVKSTEKGSPNEIGDAEVENVCDIIRGFRRLTITPGFMYEHYNYITEKGLQHDVLMHGTSSVKEIYKYYIDRQDEVCAKRLGYNYVNYAPVMAYLFTFKGYTFERFKYLRENSVFNHRHTLKPICDNYNRVYPTFLFIKKHKDAREYLIAVHYNRELRYYAEHPNEEIEGDSILNEFITRNISVQVRKMWTDTNKFVIMCEQLLQRKALSNCVQSMLIYCLAHLQIYAPIRDQLFEKLWKRGIETLNLQRGESDSGEDINKLYKSGWEITGGNSREKLDSFLNLSLKHSMLIFEHMASTNSIELVTSIIKMKEFQKYNRQYQMLYYDDLSIQGEDKKRQLDPENDIVYKGFDFHNCFNYLYVKLSSHQNYPLREFDMFTMGDLIQSRIMCRYLDGINESPNTFFYRTESSGRALDVLEKAIYIFEDYLSKYEGDKECNFYKYFARVRQELETEYSSRKNSET